MGIESEFCAPALSTASDLRGACNLNLHGTPDPLTRLLMEADGVTEAALAELLGRISQQRASRQAW